MFQDLIFLVGSNIDSILIFLTILGGMAMLFGIFLKRINQPYIIGYIFIGIALGGNGLKVINDQETIQNLGEIGIILLMFFIGLEISLPDLFKQWKTAIIGTLIQVGASVLIMLLIGYFFSWNFNRSIILGFIIALSSSAVIIKILEDKDIIETHLGKNIISILLTQDIIIVPLLIITSALGGEQFSIGKIILMGIGGVLLIALLAYLYIKKEITIPFQKRVSNDLELQVFLALLLCFGGAMITSLFHLSPALGAFVGGMTIHASKATKWIHDTLHPFRILFVAFFFISIGLQINFDFILLNIKPILVVLLVVFFTNHIINSIILKIFNSTWKEALIGGAMLAQIGELSFLICFSAFQLGVVSNFGYNFSISLISLTLIISPFYITMTEIALRNR
jgi:CPA2 family monovalent cation:H+ antiporter-2